MSPHDTPDSENGDLAAAKESCRVIREFSRAERWEIVLKQREAITSALEDSPLGALRAQWKALESAIPESLRNGRRHRDGLPVGPFRGEPLEVMCQLALEGSYPPPELLVAVAASWRAYMQAGGIKDQSGRRPALDLEDVFFGAPKRRIGNYAERCTDELGKNVRKKNFNTMFLRFLALTSRRGPWAGIEGAPPHVRLTQEAAAAVVTETPVGSKKDSDIAARKSFLREIGKKRRAAQSRCREPG